MNSRTHLLLSIVAIVVCAAFPASACITSIAPTNETISADAQQRSVLVTAPSDCAWKVAEDAVWLELVSRPPSGSGTLTYRVAANPFAEQRSTIISFNYPNGPYLPVVQNPPATPKAFRGDIDGDGYTDGFRHLVSPIDAAQWVYELSWGGPGRQTPRTKQVIPTSPYGIVVARGDFRGDGHAGFVLYHPATRMVRIVFITENGAVTVEEVRSVISPAWEIVGAGDFDGDRKADLLLRNVEARLMSIWFMNGPELVDAPLIDLHVVNYEWHIAGIADFDGNAKDDILMRNVIDGQLSVWYLNGAEVLDAPLLAHYKAAPWRAVDVGDFNGDGRFDIVFRDGSGNTEFHLRTASGTEVVSRPLLHRTQQIRAIADVNGDGADDLVFATPRLPSSQTAVMLSGQSINFSDGPKGLFQSRYRRPAAPNDFNGDGRSDLLLYNTSSRDVSTWELDGPRVIRDSVFATMAPSWAIAQVAPFSNDLMSDLQLRNGPFLAMWELAGQEILDSDEIDSSPGAPPVAAADFNGDGHSDLLMLDEATGELEIRLMVGHRLIATQAAGSNGGYEIIGAGDFDGDNVTNILFRTGGGFVVGAGQGYNEIGRGGAPLKMVDLEGDGKLELVIGDVNVVSVYHYEEGDRNVVQSHGINFGAQERLAGVGDFDGDGYVDFVSRSITSGVVSLWKRGGSSWTQTPFAQVISPEWVFTGFGMPSSQPAAAVPSGEAFSIEGSPSLVPYRGKGRTAVRIRQ